MAGEFTKSTSIKPAVIGTIANPDEYNQNIAGQSKGSILPIDVDGNFADGDLGNESIITNGALISNLKLRNTAQITTYDASGVLDETINFGQATESALGTAEIATQAEVNAATDDLKFITPLKLASKSGQILQIQEATSNVYASTTNIIPYDNSPPQNTEGAQILTLNFTPRSNNSTLYFWAEGLVDNSSSSQRALIICNTAIANCLAASTIHAGSNGRAVNISVIYKENSISTSSRTYSVRYGAQSGTSYINGAQAGARYGGTSRTTLRIIEIAN
jgi:hypothetical protein